MRKKRQIWVPGTLPQIPGSCGSSKALLRLFDDRPDIGQWKVRKIQTGKAPGPDEGPDAGSVRVGRQAAVKQDGVPDSSRRAAQEPARVSWEPDEVRPGLQDLEAGAAAGADDPLIRSDDGLVIHRKTAAACVALRHMDESQPDGFCQAEQIRVRIF